MERIIERGNLDPQVYNLVMSQRSLSAAQIYYLAIKQELTHLQYSTAPLSSPSSSFKVNQLRQNLTEIGKEKYELHKQLKAMSDFNQPVIIQQSDTSFDQTPPHRYIPHIVQYHSKTPPHLYSKDKEFMIQREEGARRRLQKRVQKKAFSVGRRHKKQRVKTEKDQGRWAQIKQSKEIKRIKF